MNISVLGCGRWGSFIGWYLDKIGHNVVMYGKSDAISYTCLLNERENEYVKLGKNIVLTDNLEKAVNESQVIIISISSQNLDDFMKEVSLYDYKDKPIVLCMKGIECKTGRRLSEIVYSYTNNKNNIAVWVGPGHIQCFTQNIPNCMVIDSYNPKLTKTLVGELSSDLIKFYEGNDIIGSEIGAAAKNVVGIAAGMLDGAGLTTLKGALMARGAREVSRLIKALGGNELSAYGLCHLGDYETTLFSPYSQNKAFGEAFIKNLPYKKLAEGAKTAEALLFLATKYKVDMPITQSVVDILNGKGSPTKILKDLFARQNKIEFY